jgi:hypothetical protein
MLVIASSAAAQIEDRVSDYAEANGEGYLQPLADAIGSDLNGGLWHSAYIPEEGFYINIETRLINVYFDDEHRTFTYTPMETDQDPTGSASLDVPTVVGDPEGGIIPTDAPPEIAYVPGFNINSFAVAVPQIRVGAVMGTEAIIRFIPAVEFGDVELGSMSLFGIGARHSISQYMAPDFPIDLAAGFFWQSLKLGDDLIETQAMTFGVQGSMAFAAGFAIIEPYAGIGYDMSSTDVSYVFDEDGPDETPIDLALETDGAARFTVGLHLRAAFLDLNGEYNFAGMNGFALGVGFGFGG